jgi:hypothetical protein
MTPRSFGGGRGCFDSALVRLTARGRRLGGLQRLRRGRGRPRAFEGLALRGQGCRLLALEDESKGSRDDLHWQTQQRSHQIIDSKLEIFCTNDFVNHRMDGEKATEPPSDGSLRGTSSCARKGRTCRFLACPICFQREHLPLPAARARHSARKWHGLWVLVIHF